MPENIFTKCGCESAGHFEDNPDEAWLHKYLGVPAGDQHALFVGRICDECAATCMAGYLCTCK